MRVRPLPGGEEAARAALEGAVAVDALFGTGARLPLAEPYRPLARALDARERPVVAIDIPSGIDALTGAVSGDAVRASVTVTLGAAKPGLFLESGARLRRRVVVCADRHRRRHSRGAAAHVRRARRRCVRASAASAKVRLREARRRARRCHRRFGAVSRRRRPLRARRSARRRRLRDGRGAAQRCRRVARASRRTSRRRARPTMRPPEASRDDLLDIAKRNGSVAIGPGLGLDERTGEIVTAFLAAQRAAGRGRRERALSPRKHSKFCAANRASLRRTPASSRGSRDEARSRTANASSEFASSSIERASRRC